jgi:hypothetical protein
VVRDSETLDFSLKVTVKSSTSVWHVFCQKETFTQGIYVWMSVKTMERLNGKWPRKSLMLKCSSNQKVIITFYALSLNCSLNVARQFCGLITNFLLRQGRTLPASLWTLERCFRNSTVQIVKENEVGRACGTHGRGEKRVEGFGGKVRRKMTTWKTKA